MTAVRSILLIFKETLPQASPKLVALLEKIAELDADDLKTHGKHFKHCIYVDSKSALYGAKLIAAALFADGYHPVYDRTFSIDERRLLAASTKPEAKGNFALLCSSTLFGKPISVHFRKELLSLFNRRPDNIHGDLARIIIIDQGFREGIDLFDTKYCHLFEELDTIANERQAIGRNTRFCGQKGLEFNPQKGWELHVYRYSIAVPESLQDSLDANRLFEIYLRNNGVNLNKMLFASTLDMVISYGAVDHDLTRNVHEFAVDNSDQKITEGLRSLLGFLSGGAGRHNRRRREWRKANLKPLPPSAPKKFHELRDYIAQRFGRYKWEKAEMENQCVTLHKSVPRACQCTPSGPSCC